MFIDEVKIRVLGGAGGNGCVSFRREKYVPFGGPNGGNGGKGGDVILIATRNKTSLLDFKYQPKYEAERGEHGMGSDMYGRGGEDLRIFVPLGTIVEDLETGEVLADLIHDGQEVTVGEGGKGGRGNLSYKTSTNRAPKTAEKGIPGTTREIRLELKVLADIGLIGLPNAGKSSFLRTVSRATPKVADYPFTTLEPHLGVAEHKNQSFVIADLPGLIEGAASGAGLGHQFLRHVARNRILLHLVDSSAPVEEILKNVQVIRAELEAFDPELSRREQILVFTKMDLLPEEERDARKAELEAAGLVGYAISSQTQYGMEPLLDRLAVAAQGWRVEEEEVLRQRALEEERASASPSPESSVSAAV